jgi:hypothetical protein
VDGLCGIGGRESCLNQWEWQPSSPEDRDSRFHSNISNLP